MLRPKDSLMQGQQHRKLVAGLGRITRLPRPVGEVAARGQGVWMLKPKGLLAYGQERSVPVARCGRVIR
jgi:hypothetical protein